MLRSAILLICVFGTGCADEGKIEPRKARLDAKRESGSPIQTSKPATDRALLHFSNDDGAPAVEVIRPETLKATYVNHFTIHSSALELIFDFGVVSEDQQNQKSRFVIAHRVALNHYTAKRLLSALEMALVRHEQAFGQLTPGEAPSDFKTESPDRVGYANFCRVMSTPEELILECGLNPQPFATGPQSVAVSHSFVMMHLTAKRLHDGLKNAIEQHEKKHGVLETDVRKRVLPGLR